MKFTGKMSQAKMSPERGHTFCAILCSRNARQDFTEQLHTEIYRKNAGAQTEHPDQPPAFTPTVRTPQCGHAVWGKMLRAVFFSNMPWLTKDPDQRSSSS
jgi:hypothetical protein